MSTATLNPPGTRRGIVRYGRKDGAKTPEQLASEAAAKAVADASAKAATDKAAADAKALKDAANNDLTVEQVTALVGTAVTTALKAELPTHLKGMITEDAIKNLISTEFANQAANAKKVTNDNIGDLVTNVCKAQMDSMRKDKKFVLSPDDVKGKLGDGGSVEFAGFSLRKGNLPLHMKQLTNCLMRKHQDEGIDKADIEKGLQHEESFWTGIKVAGAKALTSTGTGSGAEWVPRSLSSELYRRMYLESMLIQSYMATEVDMPTDPYDYPLRTTRPVFKRNRTQNNRPTATTDSGTAGFTLTTQKLMAICQFSYEADEDSIIPILPQLQADLADSAAAALEGAIINGDTTSTHMDSDVTDVDDSQTSWKGFRKLFIAASLKSDFSTGGLSRSNLLALPKQMGKFGAKTNDLLWVVGTKGWNSLMNLDEVALAYARGNGQSQYVQGGPPPAPWGGKLVISEQVKENLNASGVYDNSTTTKGTIICVNARQFVFGSRRAFTIEVARNPYAQTNDIIASFRKAFQPIETPASGTAAYGAIGYNYTA